VSERPGAAVSIHRKDDAQMSILTPADFLLMLESRLRPTRTPFSSAALIAFLESSWKLIDDHPDVAFWCERFLEMGSAVEVPA
jgi:hypothetical protein